MIFVILGIFADKIIIVVFSLIQLYNLVPLIVIVVSFMCHTPLIGVLLISSRLLLFPVYHLPFTPFSSVISIEFPSSSR